MYTAELVKRTGPHLIVPRIFEAGHKNRLLEEEEERKKATSAIVPPCTAIQLVAIKVCRVQKCPRNIGFIVELAHACQLYNIAEAL